HNRALLSFPTRRSSDLLGESELVDGQIEMRDDQLEQVQVELRLVFLRLPVRPGRVVGPQPRRQHPVAVPRRGVARQVVVELALRSEEHTSELQSRENLV